MFPADRVTGGGEQEMEVGVSLLLRTCRGPLGASAPPVTTPAGSVDIEVPVSGGRMSPPGDTGSHIKLWAVVATSVSGQLICAETSKQRQSH